MVSGRASLIWRGRRCCVLCARLVSYSHRLVITSHHILWDGWLDAGADRGAAGSVPGRAAARRAWRRWRRCARYLDRPAGGDRGAAEAAWADALAGVAGPTLIAPQASGRGRGSFPGSVRRELPAGLTAALTGRWRVGRVHPQHADPGRGLALSQSRMTGQHDVVFGATVSGRPLRSPTSSGWSGCSSTRSRSGCRYVKTRRWPAWWARVQAEQAQRRCWPTIAAAAADPADGAAAGCCSTP